MRLSHDGEQLTLSREEVEDLLTELMPSSDFLLKWATLLEQHKAAKALALEVFLSYPNLEGVNQYREALKIMGIVTSPSRVVKSRQFFRDLQEAAKTMKELT